MDYGPPPPGCRYATESDGYGRRWLVLLPVDAEDAQVSHGIRLGPPDLSPLNLPIEVEIRLNGQLYDRGLIRQRDYERRLQEVAYALQAAFRVDATRIAALFAPE
jgi:hypothetical protein